MSFKREGNDTGLLNTLRKRRIKELLCEEIPEDEAKLLSNGRFACLVCYHKPIFDTVSMLCIHRKGKKHLFNNETYLKKKKELKCLIDSRKHEQYLKDGTTSIKMVETSSKSILASKPYDPRVKKSKLKEEAHYEAKNLSVSTTKLSDVPGYSHWSETCTQQLSGPVTHSHRLKDIFSDKTPGDIRYEPYKSKYRCAAVKKAPPLLCYKDKPNQCPLDGSVVTNSKGHKCETVEVGQNISQTAKSLPVSKMTCNSHIALLSPQTEFKAKLSQNTGNVTRSCGQSSVNKSRQLPGLGWKRDWDGKWIKDETAEFDSDEEPPDIPLLL